MSCHFYPCFSWASVEIAKVSMRSTTKVNVHRQSVLILIIIITRSGCIRTVGDSRGNEYHFSGIAGRSICIADIIEISVIWNNCHRWGYTRKQYLSKFRIDYLISKALYTLTRMTRLLPSLTYSRKSCLGLVKSKFDASLACPIKIWSVLLQ